jgi:serine/threonine protein kinase/tetratricopeptide (TPR) repeat protein
MADQDPKARRTVESDDSKQDLDQSVPSPALAELSYDSDVQPRLPGAACFAPGDLLANRYRIMRFISKGGMGEVYAAEDLELRETLAVKTVLASIAANSVAIEQFKREIHLARKVTHPNVCRIFDLVYDPRPSGPVAFLTMELLDGVTLSSYIEKNGTVPLDVVLTMAGQMAEGLNAAHRAGVIHQDFKPGNVILVDVGDGGPARLVITDFGLAHNVRSADQVGGRSVGTPAYMAPEQFEGGTISVATDVYAFGVVLYEMITGRWPYNARSVEELRAKKLSQPPVPPSKYAPELPIRMERAILRCLAKKPEERFHSTLAVTAGLAPARRRWPYLAAAGLIVALLGTIGSYEWRKAGGMIGEPTIAVIGLKNNSGDAKYDWLATELSESLSTDLGGSKGIHAVPTEEIASVKTELSVPQNQSLEREDLSGVRRALGANYLLLGRYEIVAPGSNLEMSVALQDPRGKTVGDIHESGPAGKYRDLIADAASQIRDLLGHARLSDAELRQLQNLYPSVPEASQLYFQGLDKLRAFDATAALVLLKKASDLDPDNVSIHWGLSDAWAQLKHDAEAAREAQTAFALAEKASLPPEYVVLAQARAAEMNKKWDDAIEQYKHLVSLFPSHLNYGLLLASAQIEGSKATEALATLNKLAQLPPPMGTDPRIAMAKAHAYGTMNDHQSELRAAQAALDEAKKRNAKLMQARSLLELCWAYRNLGNVEQAYSTCHDAQTLFAGAGDNVNAALASNDVATWLLDRGRYAEAKQLYDSVIQANQAAGAQKDLAGACVNGAKVLDRMGKPEEAQGYIDRALATAIPIGDKSDEALARILRGDILAKQGKTSAAEQEVEHALALARDIKDQSTAETASSNLAQYQSETDTGLALATYREVLRSREEKHDLGGVGICLTNMGGVLLRRGDVSAAEQNYQKALKIDTELKDKESIATDWVSLAEVDFERGQLPAAQDKLLPAIREFRENQSSDFESQATSLLIRVLIAEKDAKAAAAYVQRIREIASKDPETDFESRLSQAEYLNALGKRDEAIQAVSSLPAQAKNAGMNFISLRARLMLVKLQKQNNAEERNELASIQTEAQRAGFGLLLRQAKNFRLHSSRDYLAADPFSPTKIHCKIS